MQSVQQMQQTSALGLFVPALLPQGCSSKRQERPRSATRSLPSARPASAIQARSASLLCRAGRSLPQIQAVAAAEDTWQLTLQTDEAKVSMRFGEIAQGDRNKIIVISDVAEGSEAEKAGLKPGQRIYEISDPINTNEMLDMRKNPSRQGALRALANRVPQQIFFTVSKSPPDVAQKLIDESGGDYRKALESQSTPTGSGVNISPERLADRQSFMETPPDSGKSTFAAVAFVLLFVLPAVFLIVAIQSGYLRQIGGDYGF
ncbi:hypothetical protein WJX84_002479 [Apatococcus fuscideae]|uniref:PDZ domain-containing protein n=1 Tax=Apatococcus fuscideae TaxID=2026836 RepID=A0AAW1T0B0_9CHLO